MFKIQRFEAEELFFPIKIENFLKFSRRKTNLWNLFKKK
jgi:hypothetical protein